MVQCVKADLDGVTAAARLVAKGGLICYPTDTVYGLGCDPLNLTAVENVMKVKGERAKAMPILVRNLESAAELAYMSDSARKVARQFWPGPITLIQKAKENVPKLLAPQGTVGLRSPNHAICLELLALCSGFLVGTSANITGRSPALSGEEALKIFGDRVGIVLDAGRSQLGIASTVVDLTGDHLSVIREGPISRDEILRCLRSKPR